MFPRKMIPSVSDLSSVYAVHVMNRTSTVCTVQLTCTRVRTFIEVNNLDYVKYFCKS